MSLHRTGAELMARGATVDLAVVRLVGLIPQDPLVSELAVAVLARLVAIGAELLLQPVGATIFDGGVTREATLGLDGRVLVRGVLVTVRRMGKRAQQDTVVSALRIQE